MTHSARGLLAGRPATRKSNVLWLDRWTRGRSARAARLAAHRGAVERSPPG